MSRAVTIRGLYKIMETRALGVAQRYIVCTVMRIDRDDFLCCVNHIALKARMNLTRIPLTPGLQNYLIESEDGHVINVLVIPADIEIRSISVHVAQMDGITGRAGTLHTAYKIGNLTGQLDERGEIVPVDTVLQIRRLHAVTAQCHINPAVLSVSILVLLFT